MVLPAAASGLPLYLALHSACEALYLWLNGSKYQSMVLSLMKDPGAPEHRWAYALLAYVAFFAATYLIVFRPAYLKRASLREALLTAVLFGAAVYGVYNLTNMFLMRGYDAKIAAIDIGYGVASMALLAYAAHAWR